MMTTTMAATVKDLRTVRYIPKPGEHQLSINLGLADAAIVFELAREIGSKPEIVQIPTNKGIEIHALLICEHCNTSPLWEETTLFKKLDEFSDRINSDAIRHVYGKSKAAT
jgi:hypothetical protein